jgi:hypothetical protein
MIPNTTVATVLNGSGSGIIPITHHINQNTNPNINTATNRPIRSIPFSFAGQTARPSVPDNRGTIYCHSFQKGST